jgi:hypothetical protein
MVMALRHDRARSGSSCSVTARTSSSRLAIRSHELVDSLEQQGAYGGFHRLEREWKLA